MTPVRDLLSRIAYLSRVAPCFLGLSLGLTTSAGANPATRVRLDPVRPGEIQTGAVCSGGRFRCFAHVPATADGQIDPTALPFGSADGRAQVPAIDPAAATAFGADDLRKAYNVPTTDIPAATVAVVDAYGYATLEADLAAYRTAYGLPACTTANGCLKIVNQTGATSPLPGPPPPGDDWTIETALDIDMVSAVCPSCKIIVVQANDDTSDGLYTSQAIAASLGATVINNSWGGSESGNAALSLESYFDQPGIAIFASAGDSGYDDGGNGPEYPGTSAHVISVGGTHLVADASTRGWTETAWSLGGSGCSLSIPKPAYQTDPTCGFKATTDIAAVGDPQTGVAYYNAGAFKSVGGTSVAAPIVAAIFAATGNGAQTSGDFVRQHASLLNDVLSGSNGTCGNILCTAGLGWDGPTGYGTPNAQLLIPEAAAGMADAGVGGGGTPGGGGGGGTGSQEVTGGCSAGNHAGGLLPVVLGIAFAYRRRRRA